MLSVLIVDDDDDLRALLALTLQDAGYRVSEAADGVAAVETYHAHRPDLVILDIGLGDVDGLEVCRRIRAVSAVPVIFLTSRAEEVDQLVGFAAGGDDYIIKPFSPRVLAARVGSLLRRGRTDASTSPSYRAGNLEVDTEGRVVLVGGEEVELTRTEFDLLVVLIDKPKRVVPRDELVERVWGSWYGDDHVVEVHMSRLRSKIGKAGGPKVGVAVRGVGYKLGVDS